MPVTPEQLKEVPLLAGLDKKSLARVANQMRERHVDAGADVVVQGQHGVGFFVILGGEATVTVDGAEKRTLGAGDYFGEIALLSQEAIRSATVTAKTDLELAGLTSWQFRPLVHEEPEIALQVMATLAERLEA
jgi:CRP/FNR family transcriptional regulator, cyclic AMP receptor protein